MNAEIKIYVADLAAYNNGKLHGIWINACDDVEDIQEQINKMLAESPEGCKRPPITPCQLASSCAVAVH
jgi:antirestriction protein